MVQLVPVCKWHRDDGSSGLGLGMPRQAALKAAAAAAAVSGGVTIRRNHSPTCGLASNQGVAGGEHSAALRHNLHNHVAGHRWSQPVHA